MSSRNRYLSPEERSAAPVVHRVIADVAKAVGKGSAAAAIAEGRQTLQAAGFRIDYLEVRDAETLKAPQPGRPKRVLVAAWLGNTRLIDNVARLVGELPVRSERPVAPPQLANRTRCATWGNARTGARIGGRGAPPPTRSVRPSFLARAVIYDGIVTRPVRQARG